MKKTFFTLFAIVGFAIAALAQTPQKMSYQSVVRTASNTLATNTAVSIKISILQGSASGTAVYVETFATTTNANGLASLEIGTGTPVTGTFAAIDWAASTYFVKTETDATGGSNYTISGTSQLMSVPYALQAKTAESVIGGYNPWANYILVNEEQPYGVNAGTTPTNAAFTRSLNTLKENVGTAFTFNPTGNSVTINENGKYYIEANATVFRSDENVIFIENIVTNQLLLEGIANFAYSNAISSTENLAALRGYITITTAPVSIRLRHYTSTSQTPNGMGIGSLLPGNPGIFSSLHIQKIKN